jgi:serralysin
VPLTSLNDATLDYDASAPEAANPDDLIWTGFGRETETTDAAASTATAYDLVVGQSGVGVLSNSADQDWFAINLVAGETYSFRLLGFDSDFLTDPLIRLMDGSGAEIVSNDDGFTSAVPSSTSDPHARDSLLTFTATTTGTHYLVADNFSTETGRYLITATDHDPAGMVFTVDEIAWQLINNGVAFFNSPEGAGFNVGGDGALTVNITGLTAAGQTLAQEALAVWSAYTGINFQFTTGVAELTFDDTQSGAFAQPIYSGGAIISSTVNIGLDWLTSFGTGLQSYSFETYIHEIGHALGLGHGGNYNGSANYNTDNFYLNDSLAWSIMSYMNTENDEFDFGGANDWNTYVDAAFRYMYSPMIADMIAIQQVYGVSSAFTGNTTWGFGGNTGVAAFDQAVTSGALMAMTVYDTGGTDTLNFGNSSANQIISLTQESLSSVLGGRDNLGIARGTVIENATGGSGNDTMFGNGSNNRLDGGQGNDDMRGFGGNDTYIVHNAGDIVRESSGGGTSDWVAAATSYVLTAGSHIERLSTTADTGTAAINLTGNALGQTITGNAGANRLDSAVGANDIMQGLGGNDTYIVRNAGDVVRETSGGGTSDRVAAARSYVLTAGAHVERLSTTADTGAAAINLTGNALGQTITGNAGANSIRGLDGKDTMSGLASNDRFIFGAGDSVVGSNRDVIMDFEDRGDNDTIDLAGFAGSLLYIGTAAFTGANQVRVLQDGSDVRIQINTAGTSGAESEILLFNTQLSTVNASDFIL